MNTLKNKVISLVLVLALLVTTCFVNVGMNEVEAATSGTISFGEKVTYGTSTLIQVRTDLPSDTPIANFTTDQNGCSIDQSGNTVQWVGWIGMAKGDDNYIYLTFNFNSAFTAGQTYVLPKGAIFGFTNGNTYSLDGDYTFTFDGSAWTMDVANRVVIPEELTFEYRYGANNLIQVNTNLPSTTPIANFTTGDNGCSIDESANQYQQVGWIEMTNADGVIVLTFHFNSAFESGQTYVLPQGAIFGFTDGNKYPLDKNYTFTFDGSSWAMTAEAEPEEPEEEIPTELTFGYRYGTNNLIQVNTNLPASTPLVNFTTGDNGCSIDESGNTVQWVGWIQMDNADGVIVLTFHFNNAFTAGQSYVLPAGAIFGFTDGNTYPLDKNYTFTFDGSSWAMTAEAEPEEEIPDEEEIGKLSLVYRYGTNNLIQVNTDLPTTTTCANFLETDNGCALVQGGSQSFGWAAMENVSGTIVITFHFNAAFTAGQTYILKKGSVFGFTDGTKYELDKTYAFTFDGTAWNVEAEETYGTISLEYRYGANNLIQVDTNLPDTTTCANFLETDNGCELIQSGSQSFGWAAMENVSGTIVITFHFNGTFTTGQTYALSQGSIFGFTDGTKYKLDNTCIFTWDGATWTLTIVGDTNDDNGVDSVDLIRMKKAESAIYTITEKYDIVSDDFIDHWDLNRERDIILERDSWDDGIMETTDYLLDPLRFDGGEDFVSFADLPVDATDTAKIEEFKALGFNTSLLTEDDANPTYSVTVEKSETAEIELKDDEQLLELSYTGYTTGSMIQILTNLPGDKEYSDFLIGQNSHELNVMSDKTVGYFQLWKDSSSNKVYFNPIYNNVCDNGDQYILKAGSKLYVDGVYYVLDRTYTFTIKNDYLASIQNLDKAGLNIWIRNYSNTKDYFTEDFTKQLALHKEKIDGFYIVDEPFMTQDLYDYSKENYSANEVTESFDNISSTLVPWFNSNYANTYFHINHVPMSSYNHYGTVGDTEASDSNYLNFFNTYASDILGSVSTSNEKKTIGFDYYPFGYTTVEKVLWWETTDLVETGIAPNYLLNMLIPAKAAKDNDATFSICIQTFDRIHENKKREITTAAEVSFQLYSAMACGADMFEFFTYNSLIDSANNTTYNGIIDLDGNKTELYDGVKTANTNAFSFADVVNAFDWQGVQVSSGSTSKNATGITTAKNSSLGLLLDDSSNGALSSVTSDDDALVGYYTKGSQAGYMVANYNDPKLVTTDNTVTLTFDGCTKARVYTAKDGELTSEVVDLTNGTYTCEVAPGEGCFIIPVNAQ